MNMRRKSVFDMPDVVKAAQDIVGRFPANERGVCEIQITAEEARELSKWSGYALDQVLPAGTKVGELFGIPLMLWEEYKPDEK